MVDHNPYAPSRAVLASIDGRGRSDEVRREGRFIRMPVDATLPHRCVKCNAPPAEPAKTRTIYWHHPAIYLVILVNIIIYAIVAYAVRKKITLEVPLCAAHKSRRRNAILLAWIGVIASFVLPIAFASEENGGAWVLFCILLFFVSCLAGIFGSRLLYGKKIDADEARLGGAGRDFLDSLPE
jgi:hypothetical protein